MKRISAYLDSWVLFVVILFVSCQKEIESLDQKPIGLIGELGKQSLYKESPRVYISDVVGLYEAVNNPLNQGATIVMAPGLYLLDATFPNSGRIELQKDMSLVGQAGNREAVIIDASNLPLSSFNLPPANSRSGAVRIGNGTNRIEWITFQNDPAHTIRSLIQTDIVKEGAARIRVSHCIIRGSSIGLSILNRDAVANGRILEAEVSDNEIYGNTIQQFGSGIQIQNTLVDDAVLRVKLSRNYIHGNKAGMMIFNSSSKRCVLDVRSNDERIEGNGIGLVLVGSLILNSTNAALDNQLDYRAYATVIEDNQGVPAPPFSFPSGGIFAPSGLAMTQFGPPGTAHRNELNIEFYGCSLNNNSGMSQIQAYGAYSYYALAPINNSTVVGTFNKTQILLAGLRSEISVNAINSVPEEAAGTNTVEIIEK